MVNPSRATLRPLLDQYRTITRGLPWWKDDYLLEKWDRGVQPVVYRDEVYHGYPLLRRLGNWCWMTRHPQTRQFLTVKFLGRDNKTELHMSEMVRQKCATQEQHYEDMSFSAIVYPMTGSDLQRISLPYGSPHNADLPLSIEEREQFIRDIVQGVASLHQAGIVHADLHPGNFGLPVPNADVIEVLLAKPPREDQIIRQDGEPTPSHLPCRVTEPDDVGFGRDGHCKVMDFGHAFEAQTGASYSRANFSEAMALPPELGPGDSTTDPFKVDSWVLGQAIYFILTDGGSIFNPGSLKFDDEYMDEYDAWWSQVQSGNVEVYSDLPVDTQRFYLPYLLGLLHQDPAQRLSPLELCHDERFIRRQKT